jgi:hypothetical protein
MLPSAARPNARRRAALAAEREAEGIHAAAARRRGAGTHSCAAGPEVVPAFSLLSIASFPLRPGQVPLQAADEDAPLALDDPWWVKLFG